MGERDIYAPGLDVNLPKLSLLVLDFPRDDRCDGSSWQTTVDAFVAAQAHTRAPAAVLSSLEAAHAF